MPSVTAPSASGDLYDTIGRGYGRSRRTDPRIAAVLHRALGDARSVANVGAGTGSYEPEDRAVIAIEPSGVMLAQRAPGSAPAVRARAEALPLADRSVDAVMAILTLHHWSDREAGLRECARVARTRLVVLTWDPDSNGFWLVRDYLPAFLALDRAQFPRVETIGAALGDDVRIEAVPLAVPRDCTAGFLGAYWRRPEAYLDPAVQAGISSFARQEPNDAAETNEGLARLRADLASGAWADRYGAIASGETLDVGYRVVVARLGQGTRSG